MIAIVIYAIAAYSITVGVLALYGMLLQHRSRASLAVLARAGVTSAPDPRRGFNPGACLLAPFWLIGHGLPVPGVAVLLLWVAVIPLYRSEQWIALVFVGTIPLAAGVALGVIGNRVAMDRRGLTQIDELSTSQLPWALGGIVLFAFVLPWIAFALGAPTPTS